MSILGKNWRIRNDDVEQNIIQKLLVNRGLTEKEAVQSYLNPSYKKGFHNPFLMKDMDKAVSRIQKAVEGHEKIMIFGDYDVDGISGTAILFKTLQLLGARVSYRLPHRLKDGYGLSNAFIEEFAKIGVNLIITVDCGISCRNQIELASSYGMDVIITDHHTIPKAFPDKAHAILHPMQPGCEYPFKGLTGSGVAFKFASALITDRFAGEEREEYLFSLLDLASLGTVADIGPIKDENRIIVKYGLEALKNTKWSGLEYLKKQAGIQPEDKLDTSTIGFRISPRINAAGRIDHPYYALQLLLHTDQDEKGQLLAQHLEKLNQDRQQMVQKALIEAEEQFAQNRDSQKIYIAWSPDWHVGILGLIASRLVERYLHPCIILQDFGDHLVASARGPQSFNMVEALTANARFLESFGGHAQAAGFSLKKENLAEFKQAMTAYAEEKLKEHEFKQDLFIDCEIKADDITPGLLSTMEQMEPFGVGNEQPLFLIRSVRPLFPKRVGKEQNHLHFQAQLGERKFPTIAFKLGEHESVLQKSPTIDLVCCLEKNTWKGNTQVQLRAVDFSGGI
jgi:single-stranded-DNA-specific exonuclease